MLFRSRLLESEMPENLLKYQIGVIITDLKNRVDSTERLIDKEKIIERKFLASIARQKEKVIQAGDIESYQYYTKAEIVLLSMVNENHDGASLAAVISDKYL